jgi:hypothetical protein
MMLEQRHARTEQFHQEGANAGGSDSVTAADNDLSAGSAGFTVTAGGPSFFKPKCCALARTELRPRPSSTAMAPAEWVGYRALSLSTSASLHTGFISAAGDSGTGFAPRGSSAGPFRPGGDRSGLPMTGGVPSATLESAAIGSMDRRSLPGFPGDSGKAVPTTALAGTAPLVAAASAFGERPPERPWFLPTTAAAGVCSIAMLPSTMVIETPSTRMLTTPNHSSTLLPARPTSANAFGTAGLLQTRHAASHGHLLELHGGGKLTSGDAVLVSPRSANQPPGRRIRRQTANYK